MFHVPELLTMKSSYVHLLGPQTNLQSYDQPVKTKTKILINAYDSGHERVYWGYANGTNMTNVWIMTIVCCRSSSLIIKVTLDRIPKSLKLSDSWTCLMSVYFHVLPF